MPIPTHRGHGFHSCQTIFGDGSGEATNPGRRHLAGTGGEGEGIWAKPGLTATGAPRHPQPTRQRSRARIRPPPDDLTPAGGGWQRRAKFVTKPTPMLMCPAVCSASRCSVSAMRSVWYQRYALSSLRRQVGYKG
jgi:hypothetical protein